MKRRKTAAEKRAEQEKQKSRAWASYKRKLERAQSFRDALAIQASPVSSSSPGRSFYSNFGFFMHYFSPPSGASVYELEQYLRLLECFEKEGVLKDGAFPKLVKIFVQAISDRAALPNRFI